MADCWSVQKMPQSQEGKSQKDVKPVVSLRLATLRQTVGQAKETKQDNTEVAASEKLGRNQVMVLSNDHSHSLPMIWTQVCW